jgi:hypothetical protein
MEVVAEVGSALLGFVLAFLGARLFLVGLLLVAFRRRQV